MDIQRPLFWHQGLFLQPQHFQLLERSQDARLNPYNQLLVPHFWGISNLEINKAALNLKSFGLISGSFLFPDGSYVEYPGNAVMVERPFDETLLESGKPLPVYIGLKKWSPGEENVATLKKGEELSDVSARYLASPNPEEIKDLHGGGPTGHVKKMDHILKVFWGTEKDNLGDYVIIPVAQLQRDGSDIILNPDYIPPCLSISGSKVLSKIIKEINDLLLSRSRELEEHKTQRGIHRAEFGSRDMVYLLALRSINRYLPELRHYVEAPQIHPWFIYGILRQIIGDLSCFSEKTNALGERADAKDKPLPLYDHNALWSCFSQAQDLIVKTLQEITAGPDHVVPLNSEEGFYSADLKPIMFQGNNRYFLALTTDQDPKTAISGMDRLAKVSSRNVLARLVSHALPGIPIEHLTLPPQELPRRSDVLYFSIDAHSKQWTDVKKEKNISLSWDGAPKNLQLELMVVSR